MNPSWFERLFPAAQPDDELGDFTATALHLGYLRGDDVSGLGGLHRERFDFRSDHGKALAGRAGARCFDSRV